MDIFFQPYTLMRILYIPLRSQSVVDFNGMSTRISLLYTKKFGNCVHYTFIVIHA